MIRAAQADLRGPRHRRHSARSVGREAGRDAAAHEERPGGAGGEGGGEGGSAAGQETRPTSTLLPTSRIQAWLVQLTSALQHIHAMHVLHRDLSVRPKP